MSTALPQEIIRRKRDGQALEDSDIRTFIAGVTNGSIPDYQAASMLMAVFLRGLDDRELATWTEAMIHSGEVIDLAHIDRRKVDKHSTGGVGDKISVCLAPAVAACGVAVPMISGRGLGHSGGTLDKLEAIPGMRVDLDTDRFSAQVADLGTCLIGQTERLAPADRKLYALRDVTATIESVPLIASSIMSKKLAEGIDALVLDCKVGAGAFMNTLDRARLLGQAIRAIGRAAGKQVSVLFTDMDAPIGMAVGNANEIAEAIAVLRGGGPSDTRELTVRLGAEMLLLGGVAANEDDGVARIEHALASGAGLEVLRKVIESQDGDPRVLDAPASVLPQAAGTRVLTAPAAGYVAAIHARTLAMAALALGAGRRRKEDAVDHAVGIDLAVRVGDRVEAGQPLANLCHNNRGLEHASALAQEAFTIASEAVAAPTSRIIEVMR